MCTNPFLQRSERTNKRTKYKSRWMIVDKFGAYAHERSKQGFSNARCEQVIKDCELALKPDYYIVNNNTMQKDF